MTRLERIAVAILLLGGICGAACKTSSRVSEHTSSSESVVSDSTTHEVVTRTEQTGPETVVTTIEEFAAPVGAVGVPPQSLAGTNGAGRPDMDPALNRGAALTAPARPESSPEHGPLVKRTVTVDQRGPSVTHEVAESQASTQTHAEAKSDSEVKSEVKRAPAVGCALGIGFYGALALVILAVVGWRFRRLLPFWPR